MPFQELSRIPPLHPDFRSRLWLLFNIITVTTTYNRLTKIPIRYAPT